MRLIRFILRISLVCAVSCLYIYQQVEIVRLGYINEKKKKELEELLDYNHLLRYNLNQNTSLTKLSSVFRENSNLSMPKELCFVRVENSLNKSKINNNSSIKSDWADRFLNFNFTTEAKAQSVNP